MKHKWRVNWFRIHNHHCYTTKLYRKALSPGIRWCMLWENSPSCSKSLCADRPRWIVIFRENTYSQKKTKKRDLDLGHLAVKAVLSFMFLHRALLKQFLMWSGIHCPNRGPQHTVCAGASRSSELKSCVGIQMNAGIHSFQQNICSRSILFIWFGF